MFWFRLILYQAIDEVNKFENTISSLIKILRKLETETNNSNLKEYRKFLYDVEFNGKNRVRYSRLLNVLEDDDFDEKEKLEEVETVFEGAFESD